MVVCYSRVTVTKPPVSNCDKNRRRQKKQQGKAPEELWCKQQRPLRLAKPSVKSLQQLFSNTANPPPPPLQPPRNLSGRRKMKNEEYYDFTHSCQKDINRIQLQWRLDTEILLCAVNKRQAASRRASLMQWYEGECMRGPGGVGRHSHFRHWPDTIILGGLQWITDRMKGRMCSGGTEKDDEANEG